MITERFNFAAQCWTDGHFFRDIVIGGVLNTIQESFRHAIPDAIEAVTSAVRDGGVLALVTGNPGHLVAGFSAAALRIGTPFAAAATALPAAAVVGVVGKVAGFIKNAVLGPKTAEVPVAKLAAPVASRTLSFA